MDLVSNLYPTNGESIGIFPNVSETELVFYFDDNKHFETILRDFCKRHNYVFKVTRQNTYLTLTIPNIE